MRRRNVLLHLVPGVVALEGRLLPSTDVLTYHGDNTRSGWDSTETTLSPADVNPGSFGKLFNMSVDGPVDAQPLYVAGVNVPGQGVHNVLYVATENDSVYAFDADSGLPLWHVSLLPAGEALYDPVQVPGLPRIGIMDTPVIDAATGTMYLVAASQSPSGGASTVRQRLHALNIATGADVVAPRLIDRSITYPGVGPGGDGTHVIFDPDQYKERDALLLVNGVVYTSWSSIFDTPPYTGWVIGYRASDLGLASILNIDPNGQPNATFLDDGSGNSFWNSNDGPAADALGNLYNISANGPFDLTLVGGFPAGGDYGDSFVKMTPGPASLTVTDYFTPADQELLATDDFDLGSSGIALADEPGPGGITLHLAIGSDKQGDIFVVNRDFMGKFHASGDAIVQELPGVLGSGLFGTPTIFGGIVYFGAVGEPIRMFAFDGGVLVPVGQTANSFSYPGTTPTVSSDGLNDGILWAAENTPNPVLHAYLATNPSVELYNSNMAAGGRDQFGVGNKFVTPVVADGRVYVATTTGVAVFGLLPATPPVFVVPPHPASRPTVNGFIALSTLATDASYPESALTYTWGAVSVPPGGAVLSFGANGTNAAQSTFATVIGVGTYIFDVTVTDPSGTPTECLTVFDVVVPTAPASATAAVMPATASARAAVTAAASSSASPSPGLALAPGDDGRGDPRRRRSRPRRRRPRHRVRGGSCSSRRGFRPRRCPPRSTPSATGGRSRAVGPAVAGLSGSLADAPRGRCRAAGLGIRPLNLVGEGGRIREIVDRGDGPSAARAACALERRPSAVVSWVDRSHLPPPPPAPEDLPFGAATSRGRAPRWVSCRASSRSRSGSSPRRTCSRTTGTTPDRGWDSTETALTPADVAPLSFGKVFNTRVDGKVDAQPLVVAGVTIPGQGVHNVLYVATEHDSVYAFDADSGAFLWRVSMLGPGEVPSDPVHGNQIEPEIGITDTPVIDPSTGIMYLVAMSKSTSGGTTPYHPRIHANRSATGADAVAPRSIDGSITYPGSGPGGNGSVVIFDPEQYKERDALLLENGVIYTGWSSHADTGPYTGWVIGFKASDLSLAYVLNIDPAGRPTSTFLDDGSGNTFWNSGDGFAADAQGNLYNISANGPFDPNLNASRFPTNGDFGDSFVKLTPSGGSLRVADYFAPADQQLLANTDFDLGSSGIALADEPGPNGTIEHLAIGSDKTGDVFVVNRDDMGKFSPAGDNVLQELPGILGGGVWGAPAVFGGIVYFGGVGQPIHMLSFVNGLLVPVGQTTTSFVYPGATPTVSSDGITDGIVWAVEDAPNEVLHAYLATDPSVELYNSDMAAGGRDWFGVGNKFITPVVADGKVYVATTTGVAAFGLLPATPPVFTQPPAAASRPTVGGFVALSTLTTDASYPESALTYTWGVVSVPPGGAVLDFGANGTNAAKSTVARVSGVGTYIFVVVVTDPGGTQTNCLALVNVVAPASASVVVAPAMSSTRGIANPATPTSDSPPSLGLTPAPATTAASIVPATATVSLRAPSSSGAGRITLVPQGAAQSRPPMPSVAHPLGDRRPFGRWRLG